MFKKKSSLLFLNILLASSLALADDIMMATSEDLKEFDQLLVKDKKPLAAPDQHKPANPRDHFLNSRDTNKNKGPAVSPFNQRSPPASASPGDASNLPPPPPNGAGGKPPPPPPAH